MSEATFHSAFGSQEVNFVVKLQGKNPDGAYQTGTVPAEWQKVHDLIVDSRRFVDADDLDSAFYIVKNLSEGKYRFSAEFNNSGHWQHGLLTTRPDGSLKLEYHYSFV